MLDATFIDGARGRVFCTLRLPDGKPHCKSVIVAPAFGDEMNKTRKMLTETAKQLNVAGIALVSIDPFGTGDSEGEFADADWATWIADLRAGIKWCKAEGMDVRGTIAVRTGALLAAEVVQAEPTLRLDATVFWQPVRQGQAMITQLLRSRVMASAVGDGVRESPSDLLQRIDADECVLAGGYPLRRALVARMLSLNLDVMLCERSGVLYSLETVRDEQLVGELREPWGGFEVVRSRCAGEPYWSSVEIVSEARIVKCTAEVFKDRFNEQR